MCTRENNLLFGQVSSCTGRYQLPIFHCSNVHPWRYARPWFGRAMFRWSHELTTSIYQIFLGVDIDRSCVEQGQEVGHRLYAVVGDDHADLGIKLEINNTGLILVTKTGHGGLSLVEIDEWLKVSRHELVPIVWKGSLSTSYYFFIHSPLYSGS